MEKTIFSQNLKILLSDLKYGFPACVIYVYFQNVYFRICKNMYFRIFACIFTRLGYYFKKNNVSLGMSYELPIYFDTKNAWGDLQIFSLQELEGQNLTMEVSYAAMFLCGNHKRLPP